MDVSQAKFNIQILSNLINSNSEYTIHQPKAFHVWIFESKCSHVFRCVFGFEKTVDVFKSIIVWQIHIIITVHRHSHILVRIVKQCCALRKLPDSLQINSHNQVARWRKHLEFHKCSWPICLRHTSDDSLREVWCKWVSGLFLRNVFGWCRSVSTSIVSLCSTHSPTSWLRQVPFIW